LYQKKSRILRRDFFQVGNKAKWLLLKQIDKMITTDTFTEELRQRLAQPLPGMEAQFKMAFAHRIEELRRNPAIPPDAKVACVLNLLHRHNGHWRIVLIQRTENPRDRHSGQVSFPGGRYEELDGELVNVALREAHEEIGVSPLEVEVLGRLTELYIPVSNFVVHPFVGVLLGPSDFIPQIGEVETILTPPLTLFMQAENRKMMDITVTHGVTLKGVPYFDVDGRVVWGATAMILSEFLDVLPGYRGQNP
jgi:8-oxo-dGTP pyrophosphatase MutT (NUDIX family)